MKGWLYKVFLFWVDVSLKYDKIKSDPEKCETDVSLGIRSLVMSIVGTVATVGCAFLTTRCILGLDGSGLGVLLLILGAIICGAATVAFFVDLVLASVVYARYQLKLNKRKIGAASMIVSLVLTVVSIGLVILVVYLFLLA